MSATNSPAGGAQPGRKPLQPGAKRTAAMTPSQRKSNERAAKQKLGMKRLELWTHIEDHKPIKEFAKLLSDRRVRELTKEK